jgi:N-methylhydantoinase B
MFGGQSGILARQWITRVGSPAESVPLAGQYQLSAGDRLTIEGGGGSGWGDPRARSAERVRDDVRSGYVSSDDAFQTYGVKITESLEVDAGATAQRRLAIPKADSN